jgi:dTDP-glucose 4,6-dehydratase
VRATRDFDRAVVLGGAGFVGSHLCDGLLDAGAAVICVDNFCTGRRENIAHLTEASRFELVHHDVTNPLPDLGPLDVIFHLASAASPVAYHRLPIETLRAGSLGTEHGLQLAERYGARFVLASTSEVYGDPEVHPQTEDYVGHVNPIGPRSVYDEAKRFAEAMAFAYARQCGVSVGIARIFNTYGPRMQPDDGRMVPAFITQALADQPCTVTGHGRQTRSICYVSDTVAGLLSLACSTEAGPINLGNPVELSVNEIAGLVAEIVGSDAGIRHIPAVVDDPQRRCPDISRAVQRLDWRPLVQLEEGLKQTISWFAEREASHLEVFTAEYSG